MDIFETMKVNFSSSDPVANISVNSFAPRESQDQNLAAVNNFNTQKGTNLALTRGMLRLATVIPTFFEPIISNITTHISNLLKKPELRRVQYMFLVGGFAESPVLQARIEKEFGKRVKVVIPPRPGTSVVSGAVLYGFNPGAISMRIMTKTIGIECYIPWNDREHVGKLQSIDNTGARFCDEGFSCFVKLGQEVPLGHQEQREFCPLWQSQNFMRLRVFGAGIAEVKYSTDRGVNLLGYMDVDLPDVGLPIHERIVDTVMKFGGTTFSVTATYRRTGKSVSAKFSFILDEISMLTNLAI